MQGFSVHFVSIQLMNIELLYYSVLYYSLSRSLFLSFSLHSLLLSLSLSLSLSLFPCLSFFLSLSLSLPGIFAPCHAVVSPVTYFANCVYDACATGGQAAALCQAVESYADLCALAGVPIAWRNKTFCGKRGIRTDTNSTLLIRPAVPIG